MSRNTEFTMGLIGGIIGFIGAIIALLVGGVGAALGATEAGTKIIILGWFGILFAIVGIVGAALVKHWTKGSGILMIVSAIGGIICVSFAYLLSFILLMIAGLMAVFKKDKK